MNSLTNTLFLLNPLARNNTAEKTWARLHKKYPQLPQKTVDITKVNLEETIKKGKFKLIVVAGGDGAVNAVCSIVSRLSTKPLISIVPLGTGNALSYCLGVETFEKAVDVILHSKETLTCDLMRTNIPEHERGVFNISAGFDARIVFNKDEFKYIGIGSYVISALRSLATHQEKKITFTIDKQVTLEARASSLVIANCPIIGQNYVVSPHARLNDGFLDCTLFSTKYAYITNLRLRGFKHPLYTELGKVHFKAKHIRIGGEPLIQVDGDAHNLKEGLEVEIMDSQVTFLRNKKEQINQLYIPFID
jgi:diacylglycerol kinase family enzyme